MSTYRPGFFFGMSIQSLSQVIKTTITRIMEYRRPMLENLNNLPWLNRQKFRQYAQVKFVSMNCYNSFSL